jgi:hypothetical protein
MQDPPERGRDTDSVKRKLLAELAASLGAAGLDPENVMLVFDETTWENGSLGGGRFINV